MPVDAKITAEVLYDLISTGKTQKQMSTELGISVPTLAKRIADIQEKQGLLLKYREIQNLQLTELQARVLEAITPEKIQEASLPQLVACYRILKDKELVSLGKPDSITGLVGYLIMLEKEQATKNTPTVDVQAYIEAEEITTELVNKEYIPKL